MNPIPNRRPPAGRSLYFFLSYAHSAPSAEEADTATDHWVRVFYEDLTLAVATQADATTGRVGFYDDLIRPGSDSNGALGEALGAAEVFIPLYSPGYFNKSWPLRERESFLQRLRTAEAVNDRQAHVLPVLWIPMLSWTAPAEVREAVALGDGVPSYAANGLRALCMLPAYRDDYVTILGRIARRVVEVAQGSPIGPSPAPPPEHLTGTVSADAQLIVAVVAPTRGERPPDRLARTYGDTPNQWRPFAEEQALPLADYVVNTAERLGLTARSVSHADEPWSMGDRAGVLLIDPWFAAQPPGLAQLDTILSGLPEWAMPLVVVDSRDPQHDEHGGTLAQEIVDMMTAPRRPRPQIVEAQDMRQFLASLPVLVTEARRRYLRLGPSYPPKEHSAGTTAS
jgi:FxsC-like protein